MIPENLVYTESHEWITTDGDVRTVGITDHAQHMLGDIVFVELPEKGKKVKKGDELLVVESPKAAAEVYAPVSGEVVEINNAVEDEPNRVNQSPYEKGWLVKIKLADPSELESLKSNTEYQEMVEG